MNHKTLLSFFIVINLSMTACSNYTLPKESKVIINQEELAQYNPKIFSKPRKVKHYNGEDQLIIKAIWFEQQHNYKKSYEYYHQLYELTHKEEYLLKELNTAYYADINSPDITHLIAYIEKQPNNLQAQRLLLSFMLKEKKYNRAKEVAQKLTQTSTQAVDFELAANPYIFTGEYQKAIELLKKAYEKTFNEEILLKIVTLEINYLHDLNTAVELLEEHRQQKGCSEKICLQLIAIYTQQKRADKLIPLYKALTESTKKEIYVEKTIESYLYNNDIDGAINYLENEYTNNELLYSLYMEKQDYAKANALTKKLLKLTHDPKWYAESAISLYESLKNKQKNPKLKLVVEEFEKALKKGVRNPIYLNYYGYTLIDTDIDVKKGLKIINQALAEEPENLYFLDSLAWGEYKLGNCSKAYPAMKKVVEIEGLKESDIIEHWNKINAKCKTN